MSRAKFTAKFKRGAAAQVEDHICPVRELADRLGPVARQANAK